MADNAQPKNKGFTIDWLVKGTLTKVGDIFDRLTGRGWKPSSSLATSELVERMKSLLDAEAREDEMGRRYVPHNIRLKMQWDKFSTDSEESIRKLENEFLVAAVDHINDRHYYTYSPLSISIKPDYFTSGVVLLVSFDKFDADDHEAAVNVTVDGLKNEDILPAGEPKRRTGKLWVRFQVEGKTIEKELELEEGKRLSVGRTKENGLQIDDQSISKAHASLLLNKEGKLIVADTGSTNGTFVEGERISYGKAMEVKPSTNLMFGLVSVDIRFALPISDKTEKLPVKTESYKVDGLEFSSRPPTEAVAPTEESDSAPNLTAAPVSNPEITVMSPVEKPASAVVENGTPKPPASSNVKRPVNRPEKTP